MGHDLLAVLLEYPALTRLPFDTLVTFIALIRHLKERILWSQHSELTDPPDTLPGSIPCFIRDSLNLSDDNTKILWEVFKGIAWIEQADNPLRLRMRQAALLPLFLRYGLTYGVGEFLNISQ
jgi:hypothetical protein